MAVANRQADSRKVDQDVPFAFDVHEREQLRRFALVGCGTFVLIMLGLAVSATLRADWTLVLDLLAAAAGIGVGSLALRHASVQVVPTTDSATMAPNRDTAYRGACIDFRQSRSVKDDVNGPAIANPND